MNDISISKSSVASSGAAPGGKVLPAKPTPEMIEAYLRANTAYWVNADKMPARIGKWRDGTPQEATAAGYRAMYAAAPDAATPDAAPGHGIRELCALKDREAIAANLLRFGNLNKHHARAVADAMLNWPAPDAPEAIPPKTLHGISREDLADIANSLDTYEKAINVGNVTGEEFGDTLVESTTAAAARFIRNALAAPLAAGSATHAGGEEWDSNPDGVKPGQDSPIRMDPETGAFDPPEEAEPKLIPAQTDAGFVRMLLWDEFPECCGSPVCDTGGEYMGQREEVMSCCGNPEPALLNEKQIVASLRERFPDPRCKRCDGKGYTDEGDPEIGSAIFECEACKGAGTTVPAAPVPDLQAVGLAGQILEARAELPSMTRHPLAAPLAAPQAQVEVEPKLIPEQTDAEFVRMLLWDEFPECCGVPVVGAEYMGQQEQVCCGNPEPALLNEKQIVNSLRVRFPEGGGAPSPAESRPICPSCKTQEVSLERVCHNSACELYARSTVVYEGWRRASPTQTTQQEPL